VFISKITLFLLILFLLVIGQNQFLSAQSPQLTFRVTHPKIGHDISSGADSLEFNIEVNSSIPQYADFMQANFFYCIPAFGHQSPVTPVGSVSVYGIGITAGSKYNYHANLNSDHINFSLESNHTWSPGDNLPTYWELVETIWTPLVKVRIKILDNTNLAGIHFFPNSMTQPINQLYVDNSGEGNQWPSILLDETKNLNQLYLQRIFSDVYNWTQTGGFITWSTTSNTSVWDSVGFINTDGSVANKLRVHTGGRLKINPGFSLTCMDSVDISEPNGLWLKSDSYGSGSFLDAGIISYHNNGSAGVERYLKQNQWHAYCIPIGATTTRPFLSLPLAMKWYDEANHVYRAIVNPSMDSILNREMLGYFVFSDPGNTTNSTIKVTGSLNTGPIGYLMTSHNGASGPDGWNFIGNPYPSAINWLSPGFSIEELDPTIYIYHPETGNYSFWNRHDQSHCTNASSVVAAQQGFYMHCHAPVPGTGSVTLDNGIRIAGNYPYYKNVESEDNLLILSAYGNGFRDEAQVWFNDESTLSFDWEHDVYKRWGSELAPQLYSELPDSNLAALDVLPWAGSNMVVSMGYKAGVSGTDTIIARNLQSFDDALPIWIKDLKENRLQELTLDSVYIFNATPSDLSDRFRIFFRDPATGIHGTAPSGFEVYSFDKCICVKRDPGFHLRGDLVLFDMAGRQVFASHVNDTELNRFYPNVTEGCYVVKVITDNTITTQKVFLRQPE
jgi:hypothetical protein